MKNTGKNAGSEKDIFEIAVGSAARALAEAGDLDVRFSTDRPGLSAGEMRLPHLPAKPSESDVAYVRGLSDSLAMRQRHHSSALHSKHQPAGSLGRAVFDMLETVRLEALAANTYSGCRANLAEVSERRGADAGLSAPLDAGTVPTPQQLASTIGFLARERLTGDAPPASLSAHIDAARASLEKAIGHHLDKLTASQQSQQATAVIARTLIADLLGSELGDDPTDQRSQEHSNPQVGDQDDSEGGSDEQPGGEDTSGNESAEEDSNPQSSEGDEHSQQTGIEDMGDMAADTGDGLMEGTVAWRPNHPLSDLPGVPYSVYTTAHDEVIAAEQLSDFEELDRLRKYLDQQMVHLAGVVSKLANRLQRRLMAQQQRFWQFDLEEGILDAARLSRVVTNPTQPLSYKLESDTKFKDTVVTLLLDNSGSMRGRPISIAAISADILARTLERCGVAVEILGFTTKAWKGGQSREDWVANHRPDKPGRLNDLRHIIYKTADTPWRRSRRNLGLMMREGLLKENIDGEALMWAHNRLIARPEDRRILMVISDGAPVDDSTLSANTGTYLEQHLRSVISWIENRSPVELLAIGIGHDVTRYYERAVTILDAEQLGGAMTDQLAELFSDTLPTPQQGLYGRRR